MIGYWATTGLVAAAFAFGGFMDLSQGADVVAGMQHLGYPLYFATLLGVWKLLGAAAVVVPGWPRLKEWAYAGMFFDLTGAAVSHAAVGDPAGNVITPLVILGLVIASMLLRPAGRRLPAAAATEASSVQREPLPAE
jgi:hypothetical protein